jgi:hypothetical protein
VHSARDTVPGAQPVPKRSSVHHRRNRPRLHAHTAGRQFYFQTEALDTQSPSPPLPPPPSSPLRSLHLIGISVRDASRLIDPQNPPRHQGVGTPLWTGILTGAQLTLSRHYRVGIWHGGVLGVHESLWVRDRFWKGRYSNLRVGRRGRVQSPSDF